MESAFSFKTANLGSWEEALVHRLNKRVRDSFSKGPVPRTQVDNLRWGYHRGYYFWLAYSFYEIPFGSALQALQ